MLRKNREKEDQEKHMDLSLVNVKLLTVEQKALTKLSEEKHKSLEKSIALKDMQHKRLTEEHKIVSKKNDTLTMKLIVLSVKHDSLSKKNETPMMKLETLSEKHETLSNNHETLLEQHTILSDTVSLHKEQHKVLTRKEKFIFKLPHYVNKKEKNLEFFSTPFYTHPCGCNICIRIDANGCGHGKAHMCLSSLKFSM